MTTSPEVNPIKADRRIITSVPVATDSENCDHVWQLATQKLELSGRKKSSLQGRKSVLVLRGDVSGSPEETVCVNTRLKAESLLLKVEIVQS